MCTGRRAAASEHRTRNLAITSPMRFRYNVCSNTEVDFHILSKTIIFNFSSDALTGDNQWPAHCQAIEKKCSKRKGTGNVKNDKSFPQTLTAVTVI